MIMNNHCIIIKTFKVSLLETTIRPAQWLANISKNNDDHVGDGDKHIDGGDNYDHDYVDGNEDDNNHNDVDGDGDDDHDDDVDPGWDRWQLWNNTGASFAFRC